MVFAIIFVLAALTYFLSGLAPDLSEARRQRQTEEALAKARDALLGYALRYRDRYPDRMYGYLPLPDLGTTRNNNVGCTQEGCNAANFAGNALNTTVIGRLPWRALGIEPLRDGNGECLWFIVSGSHQSQQRTAPMNWDALGHLDIVFAKGTAALDSALASPHERPVAIIFSPGPPLPGQDRSPAADDVSACGGNYDARNYLDPASAAALGGVTNYLASSNPANSNSAFDVTGAGTPKQLSAQGKMFSAGGNFFADGCNGAACALVANDLGLPLTGDQLFAAIRNHGAFRSDINAMLDRMADCLAASLPVSGFAPTPIPGVAPADKASGRIPDDPCYGNSQPPTNYYDNYKEMLFVAKATSGVFTVNGNAGCAGVLIFASQRGAGQLRASAAQKDDPSNYLEGINLANFIGNGSVFSGPEYLDRVSTAQSASQDIVRCIPADEGFVTTQSPGLAAAGLAQLASYESATRTLTLGQAAASPLPLAVANFLHGCAWRPSTHVLGGGLRGYFVFSINGSTSGTLPGFAFTIADGDNNGTDACGAARQHLGYSGNNTELPFIAPPKVGIEIDLIGDGSFQPISTPNHLLNGRNEEPLAYKGGHVAAIYWGGETDIQAKTNPSGPKCTPPAFDPGPVSYCYLPQEEDDNVHDQPSRPPRPQYGDRRPGFPAPPYNPPLPAPEPKDYLPGFVPAGAYPLDPFLHGTPVNQPIHLRFELTRTAVADFSLPLARVTTTGPLNLNAPGALIDGIYLAAGDRVLVRNQAAPELNGVYVWQAANLPMMRATDADSGAELAGMVVEVRQGAAGARSLWRQNATDITLGTTPLNWINFQVRLTAPATTLLASPGPELDGIKMKPGDRVLVKTVGIYVWNGAAVPMTAAADVVAGSVVQIRQGSEAGALWRFDGTGWSSPSARVATQAGMNLALPVPGGSIDGVALSAGDRVLVRSQASAAENGVYVYGGGMLARDAAWSAAALAGGLIRVIEGSDAGRAFRQSALAASGTLGVDAVRWAALDRSTAYLLEVWILADNPADPWIPHMKNTTRAMSELVPAFTPHLRDRPVIPHAFRNARIGFTVGQATSVNDQTVTIGNYFTTWLE
ncbi:MAG TPA: hypothetical protein PKC23_03825 [Candidatus Desulfobacillus sp.]|nr:hypothetical protein [Candidatus Desulfobacillus sp.]